MTLCTRVALLTVLVATCRVGGEPAASQPADAPVTAPTKATEFLTEAQLVQAFRAKQFSLIVQETFRIQKSPAVLVNFSQFRLLVLRGESYLQMRNYARAQETFTQAAEFAPDADRRAVMLATTYLLQKQVQGKYVSKAGGAGGPFLVGEAVSNSQTTKIDLLDLGQRLAAINALSHDTVAQVRELVSRKYTTLPSLEPVFHGVSEVAIVERAATGRLDETRKLQVMLGELAGLILNQAITEGNTTLGRITHVRHTLAPLRPRALVQSAPGSASEGRTPATVSPASGDSNPENIAAQKIELILEMTEKVPVQTRALAERLELDPGYYKKVEDEATALNISAHEALQNLQAVP